MGSGDDREPEDPVIRTLRLADAGRKPDRLRIKYERMSRDVFVFFRGADPLFAASWADLGPKEAGPPILLCGDLHLENFGAYRAEDGSLSFDVNDFDEAAIAPCSIDLVRCTTSILLAAQVWRLTPIRAIRTVLGFIDAYRATLAGASPDGTAREPLHPEGVVRELPGPTAIATQGEMLEALTRVGKKGQRAIRTSDDKLPGLSVSRRETIARAVEAHGRDKLGPIRVVDATGRIVGIGSLGVRRYVALVTDGDPTHDDRLYDIKEARASAIRTLAEGGTPGSWADEAARVAEAQRHLQASPAAGLGVLRIGDRTFRIRELIPDENRTRIDRFRRQAGRLRKAVGVAGRVAATSQVRGSRFAGEDRFEDLRRWAAGPGLDSVVTSAVRFAEKTRDDFKAFRRGRAGLEV